MNVRLHTGICILLMAKPTNQKEPFAILLTAQEHSCITPPIQATRFLCHL